RPRRRLRCPGAGRPRLPPAVGRRRLPALDRARRLARRARGGAHGRLPPAPGGAIEAHLATRDFSINAIAVPLAGGEAIDPFGGRGDLERRMVRAISPAVFEDDPLRLLRAVRLEDELGFRLEPGTERLV